MIFRTFTVAALTVALAGPAMAAGTARELYERALARERSARDEASGTTPEQMRRVVSAYEQLVRRYPTSGYSDNALWQAANLTMLIGDRTGDAADTRKAQQLLSMLASQYPTSRLAAQARDLLQRVGEDAPAAAAPEKSVERPAPEKASGKAPADKPAREKVPAEKPGATARPAGTPATLKEIHRTLLADGVRIVMDIDGEVEYHQEEVEKPHRVFFDLKGVRTVQSLQDVTLKFDDDVVREIRLGRHPQNVTRVVLDLQGVEGFTAYPLYGPYRLVIDLKRDAATTKVTAAPPPPIVPSLPATPPATELTPTPVPAPPKAEPKAEAKMVDAKPLLPSKPAAPVVTSPPAANSDGKFSLSRQLGLGVSRIVIDAGHGGHDPGAQGSGINEAELTLDVALRLQKLLKKQPGVEVVMTRDTDVFIPLQERTAIANREGADLFLSIHANASRNPAAHGVETYFLNFAANPEAEAVAARENAGSGQAMHSLPDIVKAIALNNKINESRDFADTVQRSMVRNLRNRNKALKDLGVKQAPFVVLIGAGMPSVLAEMSFLTNRQDGALLKTGPYRQQIAQSLFEAIVAYQQALKKLTTVANKKATF